MRWCLDCETQYPDSVDLCPNCGSDFFTDEPISQMPKAKVEKGWRKVKETQPLWPLDEQGAPVKPVLLKTVISANQLAYSMQTGLLHSAGIPTIEKYPRDGSLGKIVLGFSGSGLEIYVPETMLEDAKTLVQEDARPLPEYEEA